MNIQIIGTKKCKDTQKAIRFFKERNVAFHLVDLNERALSKGEFEKISSKLDEDELINRNSQFYKNKGYDYLEYDVYEEVFEHQELLITPVIRNGNEICSGNKPDVWKGWLT